MKLKNILVISLIISMFGTTLSGCGQKQNVENTTVKEVEETDTVEENKTTNSTNLEMQTEEKDWSKEYENYFIQHPLDIFHTTLEGNIIEEDFKITTIISNYEDKTYLSLTNNYEDKSATYELYDMNDGMLYNCITMNNESKWSKIEVTDESGNKDSTQTLEDYNPNNLGLDDKYLYNSIYCKEETIDNTIYDILSYKEEPKQTEELSDNIPIYLEDGTVLYISENSEITYNDKIYSLDKDKNVLENGEIYQTVEETKEKSQKDSNLTYYYYINRETQELCNIKAIDENKNTVIELTIKPCTTIILPATATYAEESDPITFSFSLMSIFMLSEIENTDIIDE